jgi:hypothetical protein
VAATDAQRSLHMAILDELVAGGQRQKEYSDFVIDTNKDTRPSRRNRRESTRTGRKKPGRHDIQRDPSSAILDPNRSFRNSASCLQLHRL